jgi:hypothetical protein
MSIIESGSVWQTVAAHLDTARRLGEADGRGAASRSQDIASAPRMSNRDNKAAATEFRELVGVDFDEFIRQAPIKLLLGLAKFAEPLDITVLQFADETHALFEPQRAKLLRALRYTWQRKDPETPARRRQITETVRRYRA